MSDGVRKVSDGDRKLLAVVRRVSYVIKKVKYGVRNVSDVFICHMVSGRSQEGVIWCQEGVIWFHSDHLSW